MKPSEIQVNEPVFIVSTGRCGSNMLARVLALHPDVFALHEPHPHLRTEAFTKWSTPERTALVEKRIRKKRENLIRQTAMNGLLYVESSNYASHLIEELNNLFSAKFIHLYRNGRDFVRSGLARNWYKKKSLKYRIKARVRRQYLIDIGKSIEDNLLVPPRKLKTSVEKIAWLWVEINQSILRSMSTISDDHKFSLSVEGLNESKLAELHDFLKISVDLSMIRNMLAIAHSRPNKTKNFGTPAYSDWSDDEKIRFHEIAGNMMKALGYQD